MGLPNKVTSNLNNRKLEILKSLKENLKLPDVTERLGANFWTQVGISISVWVSSDRSSL